LTPLPYFLGNDPVVLTSEFGKSGMNVEEVVSYLFISRLHAKLLIERGDLTCAFQQQRAATCR
jgi:hypothetical protein